VCTTTIDVIEALLKTCHGDVTLEGQLPGCGLDGCKYTDHMKVAPSAVTRTDTRPSAPVTAVSAVMTIALMAACVLFSATGRAGLGKREQGAGVKRVVPASIVWRRPPAVEFDDDSNRSSDYRLPRGVGTLLRVGFIDEQMGSGLKALQALLQFARATNITLVEPAAGSSAANSNFHTTCPTQPQTAAFQSFGAVYSLQRLEAAGYKVLPLAEFWRLQKCGAIPARVVLPGSWDSNGTCFTCEGESGNVTVFRHTNANRIHAGNRVRAAPTLLTSVSLYSRSAAEQCIGSQQYAAITKCPQQWDCINAHSRTVAL